MCNKKILIFANESVSNSSSNGRTLRNFLLDISKEQIAQFYIHGEPDYSVCSSYYQVSDRDALNAFLCRKNRIASREKNTEVSHSEPRKYQKNCRTMLIRDIVWRSYRWWKKDFNKFIKDFAPDVILLQAGDAPFMYAIALKISNKYKLPIVIYNSEEYVLKEKMYSGAKKYSIWHMLLHHRLKRVYKKLMQKVSFCIYSTEYLEEKYQKKYPHPGKSCTLYTVSELPLLEDTSDKNKFSLLYCGNLGVGRVYPLNEVAKVLFEVDPNAVLKVYGKFVNEEDKMLLCSNSNVFYGGIVPYDEIPGLMSNASMLIHCENLERLENLRGAFSTKIADSLACGRPFLVYATREYPFVQYLEKYNCAHIATHIEELKNILMKNFTDEAYRTKYVQNALNVAQSNHSVIVNSKQFLKILDLEKSCE